METAVETFVLLPAFTLQVSAGRAKKRGGLEVEVVCRFCVCVCRFGVPGRAELVLVGEKI